ncbi:MAG: ABC transporter substrate-binding protein [bacterium]|nr:ABC transporter substrate-binding protein [bacterium]
MRKILALLLTVMFLAIGAPSSVNAYKGTVTIALNGEPPTMDPHTFSGFIGTMVWPWVTERLVVSDTKTGKITPWLAEKYERLDSKRLKFTLRKGVRFFDGTELTSENVKYSIGRILDPKNKSRQLGYWKSFARIEILDKYTFILHTNRPDNALINRLLAWGHVISLGTKKQTLAQTSRNPIGSGPYKIASWAKGQKIVFEANPDWWANSRYPNRPKTIILRRIREGSVRVKALETGEVDLIGGVLPHLVENLRKSSKVTVMNEPAVRIMFMGFITRHGGPMANQKVRLAINYAIDAEIIRKTLVAGFADPFGQLLHPWNFSGYNPDKTWYGYDLAKAKQLLKEAGYPNGFNAEFITTNGRYPADRATCEAVVGMLAKINIKTRCNSQVFPLYRKSFNQFQKGKVKGAAMYYMGFGNGSGEPNVSLVGTSGCTGAWSGHCFKDLDAQIDKAGGTEDPAQQQKEYEKVTDMMKEKATHKIFFKIHNIFGVSKRIEFLPRHDETLQPWEISVKPSM